MAESAVGLLREFRGRRPSALDRLPEEDEVLRGVGKDRGIKLRGDLEGDGSGAEERLHVDGSAAPVCADDVSDGLGDAGLAAEVLH